MDDTTTGEIYGGSLAASGSAPATELVDGSATCAQTLETVIAASE